jgi:hypothetical protein
MPQFRFLSRWGSDRSWAPTITARGPGSMMGNARNDLEAVIEDRSHGLEGLLTLLLTPWEDHFLGTFFEALPYLHNSPQNMVDESDRRNRRLAIYLNYARAIINDIRRSQRSLRLLHDVPNTRRRHGVHRKRPSETD